MALTHARSAGIGAIMLYAFLRPMLFRLDGETAHRLTVKAMTLLPSGKPDAEDAALASTVAGRRFPNPVSLAAGFDKDGAVAHKKIGGASCRERVDPYVWISEVPESFTIKKTKQKI